MKIHGVCDFFSRIGEGFCTAGRAILDGTQKVAMAILRCPLRVARGCFLAGRAVVGCAGRAIRRTATKVADTFMGVFASREQREWNQFLRTVLRRLNNETVFGSDTLKDVDNVIGRFAGNNLHLTERNANAIRAAVNSLLDRGFTVQHRLEEVSSIFPAKWEEGQLIKDNEKAMATIERAIPTGGFWTKKTSDKGFDEIATDQIEGISAFYKAKGVPNPEDLAHHLILRCACDYNGTTIFKHFSMIENFSMIHYFTAKRSEEDPEGGYYFGFENGVATVVHKGRYTKIDPKEIDPPQLLEVTRSLSLDPQNISSAWDEVVTIRRLEE